MSRMQEALSRKDYDCVKPAAPVAATCEADAQERSDERYDKKTLGESDSRERRRNAILWIVRHSVSKGDRPAPGSTSRLKVPRVAKANSPRARRRPQARSLSIPRQEAVSSPPRQDERESVEAQIQRFQARADLRDCLLPGMLSRISRKACEGWQHQATVRTSRIMTKMKLDPCRKCQVQA